MEKSGISAGTILAIVFIVLKLVHVIDWPWIWVISPIWIPILICLLIWGIVWIRMH